MERTDAARVVQPDQSSLSFPAEVERVFRDFRCAEMGTVAKDGTPIAWPIIVLYRPERGCFVTTTSIGLPQKAFNLRRDPRVSLLYSDPTGSGLVDPPAVLVQGEATVSRDIVTWDEDLHDLWKLLAVRQPAANMFSSNWFMRRLMGWYFMRLIITIVPKQVLLWESGDFTRPAREIEVRHVG